MFNGRLFLSSRDNTIRIFGIESYQKGSGRIIMGKLIELLDQHKLDCGLFVEANPSGTMNNDQLKQWYGRLGFKHNPNPLGYEMIRKHK